MGSEIRVVANRCRATRGLVRLVLGAGVVLAQLRGLEKSFAGNVAALPGRSGGVVSKGDQSAFPLQFKHESIGEGFSLGLTKREYFAGMALQGMMSRDSYDKGQATPEQRAKLALIEADALLEELGKGES
jgi:hypothetical protein